MTFLLTIISFRDGRNVMFMEQGGYDIVEGK